MRRWTTGLVVMALAVAGLAVAMTVEGSPAGAQSAGGITIQQTASPAFNGDAPDPDVVRDGSDYYAFTTGTVLGNHLQALVDTSGSPESGWRSYTGTSYGSTALPVVPSWEQINTQTSPGVFYWGGQWIMYYDASQKGHAAGTGNNCLSVATATTLTPTDPVFTDNSSGPFLCQPQQGGAIDPSPFVDPVTGNAYLIWKSNDGGSSQPAEIWSDQLSANGLSLVGTPQVLLTQDSTDYPFETTIENPDMVDVGGTYILLFSTGAWDSSSYGEDFAACAGPSGPCTQGQSAPVLSSYGSAAGPGGGSLFQDGAGNWYLAYAAWAPGCTNYSCGGARRLFVAPTIITPAALATPVTGMASTPTGDGYWLVNSNGAVTGHGDAEGYGSMAGHQLNAPVEHIVATPDGKGYWLVAADGGVFAFGDAGFHGSMGGQHLNQPVVGISADYASGGYWEVASDGGIFAFGAPFFGSTGNLILNRPVNGMAGTTNDGGYWFVASDGGVFAFGDAGFHGSMGGSFLNAPVVGMAADPATGGYWLVGSDGGIFAFGAPFLGAD